jgi:hypothetical protein
VLADEKTRGVSRLLAETEASYPKTRQARTESEALVSQAKMAIADFRNQLEAHRVLTEETKVRTMGDRCNLRVLVSRRSVARCEGIRHSSSEGSQ